MPGGKQHENDFTVSKTIHIKNYYSNGNADNNNTHKIST